MSVSPDGPTLWPARHIGEHAYCPRLFYYMQVEGVFIPSADTEQGKGVHQRVDRPSVGVPTSVVPAGAGSDADQPRTVRSLALTSERLALTATLDLVEVREGPADRRVAVPVEYRKGRPRHISFGRDALPDDEREPGQEPLSLVEPWPTDRVQIGLQVLLLEEAGYTVPFAVLYYAQERRRLEVVVDDALRACALSELAAAKRVAEGPRPLPLVDDPKCPKCSLQPICLPDEVNFQRRVGLTVAGHPVSDIPTPRKMWPPRDDGIHVVTQTEGVRIGVRGSALRFSDRDGETVRDMPIATIESLAIVGHVQLTTHALHVLADHSVPIVFMTSAGRCVSWVDTPGPTSADVKTRQVERLRAPSAAIELARALVAAKITNQRTVLVRNTPDLPAGIADELKRQATEAIAAPSESVLLGREGQAAAVYFGQFPGMIRDPGVRARFEVNGRKRRPPPDPINCVLSFAYSMLTHECVSALRTASLEPAIGAYHKTRPGKPALALDLMEPFRPLIADSVVISMFNRGEVGPGHFVDTAAGCSLTDAGRRAFFDAWGRRMATEVTHPTFEYRLSYRRMLMLHAKLIAAWLMGEATTLSFLTTR